MMATSTSISFSTVGKESESGQHADPLCPLSPLHGDSSSSLQYADSQPLLHSPVLASSSSGGSIERKELVQSMLKPVFIFYKDRTQYTVSIR